MQLRNTRYGGRPGRFLYHRKTPSRSSIDWTLIGVGDGFVPSPVDDNDDAANRDFTKDQNERLATLKNDDNKNMLLPYFADRLTALERQSAHLAIFNGQPF
jgi:hypothetical protein